METQGKVCVSCLKFQQTYVNRKRGESEEADDGLVTTA